MEISPFNTCSCDSTRKTGLPRRQHCFPNHRGNLSITWQLTYMELMCLDVVTRRQLCRAGGLPSLCLFMFVLVVGQSPPSAECRRLHCKRCRGTRPSHIVQCLQKPFESFLFPRPSFPGRGSSMSSIFPRLKRPESRVQTIMRSKTCKQSKPALYHVLTTTNVDDARHRS